MHKFKVPQYYMEEEPMGAILMLWQTFGAYPTLQYWSRSGKGPGA